MLFLSSLASRLLFVCRAVLGWPKWLSHHFSAHLVADFKRLIEEDADIYMGFHQIFDEIPDQPQYQDDPTGNPQAQSYSEMLLRFQSLLTHAPEFGIDSSPTGELIPVPLNALFNWPMNTPSSLRVFTNPHVNAQLKNLLTTWSRFLASPESRYVLTSTHPRGWFTPAALDAMPEFTSTYICDPTKEYWGFKSWDDFFTRQFRPGLRPIASPENNTVITSACESVPYKLSTNAQLTSRFWLKAEHYSLFHMFNGDPFTPQFVGGTVYQAYLSTLYYHRWHSPVCGRVVKIVHVPGAYCAVSPSTGFHTLNGPDPGAPGNSQAFLTNIATRMLIFIHAESKDIGLMCFIAVGMVEVSSCEATVSAGEWVAKGQELGMFHYGGSTYCLVFREETARRLAFSEEIKRGLEDGKAKVLLNASIAYVTK